MDQDTFQAANPILDEIAEIFDRLLESPDGSLLRDKLQELSEVVGGGYSVNLTCLVDVFDDKRETSLPLLTSGLSSSKGQQPYRTDGDSTPHRYIVDGEIQVVPHDRCPKCWNVWDFKLLNLRCGTCGAELGQNCKLLLDSDICPSCEEGKVTASQPKCSNCAYRVDLSIVTWG
jgi:hypothetical protein